MATELVPTNIKLPAHLTSRVGQPSAITADISSGGGDGFKRISKRGGRWRIRDGSNETVLPSDTLRAIIVGASGALPTKLFYKNGFEPDENKGPDCYSNDGVRPAADASDPQNSLCATCDKNAWGSKIADNGNKMKACADQKKLAIISAEDNSEDPEVYLYTVTPSELTDFRNYGKLLAARGFPAELVVTELTFDTKPSYPKVQFKFGGFVDESMVATIDKLVDSDKVNEIVGKTTPAATVVEAPKPPVIKPKKPEVEDAVFEEIEPTKPVTGFGAAPKKVEPPKPAAPAAPPVVQSSQLTADIQAILDGMEDADDE